jgi:hypothetical protein
MQVSQESNPGQTVSNSGVPASVNLRWPDCHGRLAITGLTNQRVKRLNNSK